MVKNTLNVGRIDEGFVLVISRQAVAWTSINTCIWIN